MPIMPQFPNSRSLATRYSCGRSIDLIAVSAQQL